MPTNNRIPATTIADGFRLLADLTEQAPQFADAMNMPAGPRVTIHLNNTADVDEFARLFDANTIHGEVGDGDYASATADFAGLGVVVWARAQVEAVAS